MKSSLKNYRQSPRKVRLVADTIRGKKVPQALLELQFLPKRAAQQIAKLVASAAANAQNNFKVNQDDLVVKDISVDQGVTLKRYRPRARGVAKRINKRTSNITLSLGVKEDK
jgi:large subunit ribosomal protein L22